VLTAAAAGLRMDAKEQAGTGQNDEYERHLGTAEKHRPVFMPKPSRNRAFRKQAGFAV